jgi:CBS domain-containing protein
MSGHHPPPVPESALDEAGGSPIVDLLPELTESDVAEAMRDIPGYLDISPQDFRELYRASATHALARLAGNPVGRSLMRVGGPALEPHQYLPEAIARMVDHGVKSAAVVDETQKVIGILTETDVLRQLKVSSSLGLLVLLSEDPVAVQHCCSKVRVDAVMTSPAQTLSADATLPAMTAAFRGHGGRSMPVVDESGRLLGMLGRKDLIRSCGLGGARP